MHPTTLTSLTRMTLIVVVIFNAVSAAGGAIGMMFTGGLGMPANLLEGSPFSSFMAPALILLVVIGGTHALAAMLLLRRRRSSLLWSAIAGFGMIIWILTEIVIISGFNWIQGVYFATGIVELALVLALLGIVTWIPRMESAVRSA